MSGMILHHAKQVQLGDVLFFKRTFCDGVVNIARQREVMVVRISMTKITVAFKTRPKLVFNTMAKFAWFKYEGFNFCREFTTHDLLTNTTLVERAGLPVKE